LPSSLEFLFFFLINLIKFFMKRILLLMATCLLLTVTMATHAAEKMVPTYTIPSPFTVTVGIPLSKIFLPLGFSWETPGTFTSMTPGTETVRAKFTPADTENYLIVGNIPIAINYIAEPPYTKPTHDIVFLLDNSGSLGPTNFNLEKQAIISLCDAFAADPHVEYRIAVIDFDSQSTLRVPFSKINGAGANYTAVRNAINAIPYRGGGTTLTPAANIAINLLNNQSTADFQSVFLLTDGVVSDPAVLNKIKENTNATCYSIGFASYSLSQLNQFATDPSKVYTSANASGLANVVTSVSNDFFKNDYSLIQAYLNRIPSDLSGYTQISITAVNNAISQIIYGDKISQTQIDGWAATLLTAINNLTLILQNNLAVTCDDITYGESLYLVIANPSGGIFTHTYAVRGSSSFSSTVPTNAGEYTVKVVSAATATYYAAEAFANFTILPKPVTVSGITATKRYNGTNSFTTAQIDISNVVITGIINSDVVTLEKTGVTGALPSANAGTSGNLTLSGSFALAGTNAANYILTEQPTVAASITKAAGSFGIPDEINVIYTPKLTLADITLPIGYVWDEPATPLSTGNGQTFTATYTNPSGNHNPANGEIKVNVLCVHDFSKLGTLVNSANCDTPAKHKAKCSVCGEERASDLLDGAPVLEYIAVNASNFPDTNFRTFITANFDNEKDGYLTCDQMLGIKTLDISNQGIEDLTGICYFTGLKELFVQDNKLTTLDVSCLAHLQSLNYCGNPLTFINTGTAKWIIDCENNNGDNYVVPPITPPTNCIDVAINAVNFPDANFRTFIAANFDKDKDGILTCDQILGIKILDISGQDIADLTGINFFVGLQYLHVKNNKLTALDVSGLTHLQGLDCNNNQLTSLNIAGLEFLKYLTCDNNQLATLKMSKRTNLITYSGDKETRIIKDEIDEDTISVNVYPNPTTDQIYLSTDANVKLYSLQGVLLYSGYGDRIDLIGYSQGVYILQINESTIVKVVKL